MNTTNNNELYKFPDDIGSFLYDLLRIKKINSILKYLIPMLKKFNAQGTKMPYDIHEAYLSKQIAEVYTYYFFPQNMLKIIKPLSDIFKYSKNNNNAILKKSKLYTLDLGCGPATSTAGFLHFLNVNKIKRDFVVEGLDVSSHFVELSNRLIHHIFETYYPGQNSKYNFKEELLTPAQDNLSLNKKYDYIFMQNVLSELFLNEYLEFCGLKDKDQALIRIAENAAKYLITLFMNILNVNGYLIIIEPADKFHSEFLNLTGRLIKNAGIEMKLFSPCLCDSACRGVKSESHWCSESLHWEYYKKIARVDDRIGVPKRKLKFSYLIFTRNETILDKITEYPSDKIYRVIGKPLKQKGKQLIKLCGKQGYFDFDMLDRDKNENNNLVMKAKIGDMIYISSFKNVNSALSRITKDSKVNIV